MSDTRSDVELTSISNLEATPHAAVFQREDPRVIRLELDAGESVPEHEHPGTNVVIALLEGGLSLALDGEDVTMNEGDVVRFDGRRTVEPQAVTDSKALVVLASTSG